MLANLWLRILISFVCGLVLSSAVANRQGMLKPLPMALLLVLYAPMIYAGFFYAGYPVTQANVLRLVASLILGTGLLTLGGYLMMKSEAQAFRPALERFVFGILLFSGIFFNEMLKPIM